MGPNPLKICEELLEDTSLPQGATICDLGSGTGITSVLLSREFGFNTYAVDLWSDPEENMRFFQEMQVDQELIHPIKADASQGLPFPHEFFDAIVNIDSYNYFGRDPHYLSEKLLPYVKNGGTLHLAFPGAKKDFHNDIPECLLKSWTPEQLDYMHDLTWWKEIISKTEAVEILEMKEMACTQEAWEDWLVCENEYAQSDRASIDAGALHYLNTLSITLRKIG